MPGGAANSKIPKGWPAGIVYLQAPAYSKKLADKALEALLVPKASLSSVTVLPKATGPFSTVKIVKISSESHPAYGQNGLFANQHLPPDSFVLPYLGFVHDRSETDEHSDYDLSLDRYLGVGVDASKMGNEARFCNDYRGVGSSANAEFREVWTDIGNGKAEKRMAVYVLSAGKSGKRSKGVAKGEEILVSYGKGFWSERQNAT
ncbi:hypothetical protein GQ43DRAFT_155872 [Delitschia confertaspora ATCC 74209]|uniref:SET domain-containing protein n=1 Tax=Delitschia confertaspora ATCC 74209 TaxID=1513339 RepID=A0A9P4MVZ8_9PLEO|nr:hypothetical protein GQ43DRAFT_155872 [Delitschia confertaspora ATCC 74209]